MILPDWFWRLYGRRLVTPYNDKQVNITSYDLQLEHFIRLQCYRGKEYNDALAIINYDGSMAYFYDGYWRRSTEPFLPGDSVLASTYETLHVPRWIRLQGMLKSSLARAGINHRTALYIDPGFVGQLTLEIQFDRSGYLLPHLPIIQVEAQTALPWNTYNGHYQFQSGPSSNLNRDGIAFRPVHHE